MAFDEVLGERLRDALAGRTDVAEKRMFGGLAFMVRGHMAVGIVEEDLCARVGKDGYDAALSEPGARPMDFTGKPMTTMVYVTPEAIESDEALRAWVERCLAFVETLPPK